jgi:hypothetical protein
VINLTANELNKTFERGAAGKHVRVRFASGGSVLYSPQLIYAPLFLAYSGYLRVFERYEILPFK